MISEKIKELNGSLPKNVCLIAVSKTKPVSALQEAYDAGQRHFGENKVQELCEKQECLPSDIHWHLIGHLQSNKVKYIAPFVRLIHSVDGPELLDEIQKRAAAADRRIGVLVQVHIACEETKHGLDANEAEALISEWDGQRWPSVELRGLMGMASNTDDEGLVGREFRGLADLFDRLKKGARAGHPEFDTLSMGMSGDAALAVNCGSTLVRVGTALFGPRR